MSKASFDFSGSMRDLCIDITQRHPVFQHIDMADVAVAFAQARRNVSYGLQAKLTPMRFEGGAESVFRDGEEWTVQKLIVDGREMLYILTFYLPRFLNLSFQEKLTTVFHELYHISADFDGDIRRFGGHFYVHSHSQAEYDAQMEVYSQEYLSGRPPESLLKFLRVDFKTLQQHFGGVVGLQIPIPRLIPKRRTA
ncbi:MAG: putative metallopeptidase [Planctomycetaceae bacterium]